MPKKKPIKHKKIIPPQTREAVSKAFQGNQWWRLRAKHGRDKLFATPDLLWDAAVEYFEHTDKRKWKKKDWVGKDALEVERESDTPYTISGLCLYLGVDRTFWNQFRAANHDGFSPIIQAIENIIYTQKFEGASVGAFNANIIARDLGLKEQADITSNGKEIAPVITAMVDGQVISGELK